MLHAICLINTERKKINEVADRMLEIEGVSEVYSVGGRCDLVAIIRVCRDEDLAKVVTTQMHEIEGITNTETMVAFRAFSRHDLEAFFDIGNP
jgi:DNA-binding Lrp family transcriptional regulator